MFKRIIFLKVQIHSSGSLPRINVGNNVSQLKQPHPRCPSSHQIKQLRPKILQITETQNLSTKNCTILITKSTSDPLKASPTTTQPLETQLNNIEERTRLTVAPRELKNWWWRRWHGASDGWQRWREPVMGGDEKKEIGFKNLWVWRELVMGGEKYDCHDASHCQIHDILQTHKFLNSISFFST